MSKQIKRKAEYKPLLFTTTMRSFDRMKKFLAILSKYEGKILDNNLINIIAKDIIKNGLYSPTVAKITALSYLNNSLENLEDEDLDNIIKHCKQEHKEAGFDRGWASRFDTWYKFAKELGFTYYQIDKKIEISETGKKLIKALSDENYTLEENVMLNAFVKYQRNNPFRRVLNQNKPLILLLSLLKHMKDKDSSSNGISLLEIPLILCWRDDNYIALYIKILETRKKYGYSPSNEVILEICDELTIGRHNSQPDKTIMKEYPDEFIRKMRLTGLITIRGFGKFVDINLNEIETIEYVLEKYSKLENFVDDEYAHYKYMSIIDEQLISNVEMSTHSATPAHLKRWAEHYQYNDVKKELLKLANDSSTTDNVLKYISKPLRLEFLVALIIAIKYKQIEVYPKYIVDDEGLPTRFAGGNQADIECIEQKNAILLEVTLLTGTTQHIRESYSVTRHLEEYLTTNINTISIIIAPTIHNDTKEHALFPRTTCRLP